MEENKITAITKEKADVLKGSYKDALEILDAYDHQTLTRLEGTYCFWSGTMRCLLTERRESVMHYWLRLF